MTLRIDPRRVEDAAKELYIRALKMLPPDVKRGFVFDAVLALFALVLLGGGLYAVRAMAG
jgi:hypothetical protein